ncbi:sulfur carrier protein ThiS [Massilia sp. Leaf139]|uniref:sulfur carrier protein ThiS n=1 Tax=Massilia sp. Leaf139 TaxID=1736272 RepID=UPI0006FF59CF|nr:sulfur carrier protein ThiS [Massilia sp. Leaf139]KQQ92066.1 thiamine biosynthesis protein ThiS [Massilia sp. Leaf139]
MLDIDLNGEPYRLPQGQTLDDLVRALGIGGQAVALAVNRQVVPRRLWGERPLAQQDRVDIVRAIGGG